MTNSQLYFAIGVPCFTILAALIVNILTVLGVRGDIREIGRISGKFGRT